MADVANTLEVMDFILGMMKDLEKAKADDGDVSIVEYVSIALGNASAGVKAAMGAGAIGSELKDLESAEIKEIAEKGVEIAKVAMALFGVSA